MSTCAGRLALAVVPMPPVPTCRFSQVSALSGARAKVGERAARVLAGTEATPEASRSATGATSTAAPAAAVAAPANAAAGGTGKGKGGKKAAAAAEGAAGTAGEEGEGLVRSAGLVTISADDAVAALGETLYAEARAHTGHSHTHHPCPLCCRRSVLLAEPIHPSPQLFFCSLLSPRSSTSTSVLVALCGPL